MKSSLERERELSYNLLSVAPAKSDGYDSQATRRTLSDSVTALCPTITPYDWQLDLAEALTLGLDATVIAGTGSGKTLPWALPLLLEKNRGRICLIISPLNELEADHVGVHPVYNKSHSHTSPLRLGSSPRSSKYLLWPSTVIRGTPEKDPYEVYVDCHYMRPIFLTGPTGREG